MIFYEQCGRPYYLGKCKCGADIGGQGHKLHAGNRQDTGSEFFCVLFVAYNILLYIISKSVVFY